MMIDVVVVSALWLSLPCVEEPDSVSATVYGTNMYPKLAVVSNKKEWKHSWGCIIPHVGRQSATQNVFLMWVRTLNSYILLLIATQCDQNITLLILAPWQNFPHSQGYFYNL